MSTSKDRELEFENLSSFSKSSDGKRSPVRDGITDPIWEKDLKTSSKYALELELINSLLQGETAQVKSRVLEFILKVGIKPHDKEFFCLFIALGWVHSMLIDAPENIKQIFAEIKLHLGEWEQTNLKILQQLAEKTENLAKMADFSVKLSSSLSELIELCTQLSVRLSNSEKKQAQSIDNWQSLKTELTQTRQNIALTQKYVEGIEIGLTRLAGQISTLTLPLHQKSLMPPTPLKKNWKGNFLIFICVINFIFTSSALFLVWSSVSAIDHFNALLLENKEINGWLLAKQNRRDCRDRLLPPTNPVCRELRK